MAAAKPSTKTTAALLSAKTKAAVKAAGDPTEKVYEPPAGWKAPKTLGAVADKLFTTRNARLALAKEVDALQAEETALKNHLIATLPKSDANGVAGKLCRVAVNKKDVARVEDWPGFYAGLVADYTSHMRKKDGLQDGAFALLQRSLGKAAVKEAWENGKAVKGVGKFTVIDVSINKL